MGTPPPDPSSGRLLFEGFELRLDTLELTRDGLPVKLQRQPARLLRLLALHAGSAVSRDELRRQLWGDETFLEVEPGLNFAVRQLRRALDDSFAEPRFVETLPRFGYRFLPPVRRLEDGVLPPRAEEPPAAAAPVRGWRRRAAGALLVLLLLGTGGGARGNRREARPVPPAAREAYFRGLYLSRRPGREAEAVAELERATRLAPRFAAAWSSLAHAQLGGFSRPAAQFAGGVEAAARQALRLDPRDPEAAQAHRALGELSLFALYDLRRAGAELGLALAEEPRSPEAHLSYAKYLAAVGRLDEAIAEGERARRLDPASMLVTSDLVWFHYLARHYDEAIRQARLASRLEPRNGGALFYWVLAAESRGDEVAALPPARALAALLASYLKAPPPPRFARLHDFWAWFAGLRAAVGLSPADLAVAALAGGDRSAALDLLEEACRQHFGWELPFLPYDPVADPLRGDRRFVAVLRCAGHAPPGSPI
ncbi:MAG TPA: winged helix-turn-helix domain-containing protein [Thermoanaerobaculia bacterium]|jgi:DNA-binding winged helix-turn-helix (wHTH) protein